jgi:hypothetical protein
MTDPYARLFFTAFQHAKAAIDANDSVEFTKAVNTFAGSDPRSDEPPLSIDLPVRTQGTHDITATQTTQGTQVPFELAPPGQLTPPFRRHLPAKPT